MLNRRLVIALFLALCSHAHAVVAQPMALPQATGEPHTGSIATAAESSYSAQVIFVNLVGDWASLGQAIGDLLLMHQIVPQFEHRRALTEQDLLEQGQSGARRTATVWIVMQHPQLVRLVFADPRTQRFLVRDIPLTQGLDELGRESVAQVVESSTLALLQGSVGLSRAEVQTALGPSLSRSIEPPRSSSPWRAYPPTPAAAEAASSRWRARLGVSYQASLTGKDFGLEHGPGIAAGLEYLRPTDSFIALGAFEWRFEKEHQNAEFKLAVQNNLAWLLLGWRKPTPDACIVTFFGPGLQLSRVRPTLVVNDAAASTTDRLLHVSPWVRLATGFEWDTSAFALQILGKIDVSAYKTHYDIERNGNPPQQLVSSWVIQPGIVLAALWR